MTQWHTQYWGLKILGVIGLTLVVFALPHLMPEPFLALYGAAKTDILRQQELTSTYLLDQSLWSQYYNWLVQIFTGQWPNSRFYARLTGYQLWEASVRTLVLLGWTTLMFSLWWLVWHWLRRARSSQHSVAGSFVLLVFIVTLPNFLMVVLVRDTLVWQVGWISLAQLPMLSPYYLFNPIHMLLPASFLTLTPIMIWLAVSRQNTPQTPSSVISEQFWRWCRVFVAGFLLQVFLTEYVLSIPGLGQVGLRALKRRDIPIVQGFILCTAGLYLFLQVLIDWRAKWHQLAYSPLTSILFMPLSGQLLRHHLYSGISGISGMIVLSVSSSYLMPYDPANIHTGDQLLQSNYRFVMGTDFLGRDVLSRTLQGFHYMIPNVLAIVGFTGGLASMVFGLSRLFPRYLRYSADMSFTLVDSLPHFLLTSVAFLIFEECKWGLEMALVIGGFPLGYRLLASPAPLAVRLTSLARLGANALLLTVTFRLLNLTPDSSASTWGVDLRSGMRYSQDNMWLLTGPALAFAWSHYNFSLLGHLLPTSKSIEPTTAPPTTHLQVDAY